MKRLFIILFAVLAIGAYAGPFEVSYDFEIAWVPFGASVEYTRLPTEFISGGYICNYEMNYYDSRNLFHSKFYIEAEVFDLFFAGGGLGALFSLESSDQYAIQGHPTFSDYLVNLGVRFNNFEIGLERYCVHPMLSYNYSYVLTSLRGESSYGKVYIKWSGKL